MGSLDLGANPDILEKELTSRLTDDGGTNVPKTNTQITIQPPADLDIPQEELAPRLTDDEGANVRRNFEDDG